MNRFRYPAALCLLFVAWLAGCGGGGVTNPITIEIQPSITESVDVGKTIDYTAFLGNDTNNQGVTWTISGTNCSGGGVGVMGGCGELTNNQPLSVTYVAPTGISAGLSVTLTATSAAQKSVTKTATINVVLVPTFSTIDAAGWEERRAL